MQSPFAIFKQNKPHTKHLIQLAYPVIASQIGQVMFGFVDNLMIGRVGANELAAAGISNAVLFLFLVIGIGLTFAISPITSKHKGEKPQEPLGNILWSAFYVTLPIALILMASIQLMVHYIDILGQTPEITRLMSSYLTILNLSIPFFLIFQTIRQFIEGLGYTRPAMMITWIAVFINAWVNYLLIFGNWGFPEMGLDGAGWATVFSRFTMVIGILIFIKYSHSVKKHFDRTTKKINYEVAKNIFKVGLPTGFQYVFEIGAFGGASVIIGWIGANELAAHQIAIGLASITYMATTGISAAGAIQVGFFLGEKNYYMVRLTGKLCVYLVTIYMVVCGLLFILLNPWLPLIYLNDPLVVPIASGLLIIAALFQVSDGIQSVGLGILRGLQDTKIPTLITFFAYWMLGLPIGVVLAFPVGWGVYGIWVGLSVGLLVSAILLTYRFFHKTKLS